MTKRRKILILSTAVIVLLVATLWLALAGQREPMLQEKPLSYWTDRLNSGITDDLEREFAKFGPKALPVLEAALKKQPGIFNNPYTKAYPKLPAFLQLRLPQPLDTTKVRWQAANMLSAMGSNAAPAIPTLLIALKDKQSRVRVSASGALMFIRLRLGKAHPLDAEVVAQLSEAAKDPDRGVRWNIISHLPLFGPPATNAISVIQAATLDSDLQVRRSATNSLRQISDLQRK